MHRIVLTARAIRDLRSLDHEMRRSIGAKLREFAREPSAYARKLTHAKIGTWRFRVGDYRVICDIDSETIVVLRIGHRRDIYR